MYYFNNSLLNCNTLLPVFTGYNSRHDTPDSFSNLSFFFFFQFIFFFSETILHFQSVCLEFSFLNNHFALHFMRTAKAFFLPVTLLKEEPDTHKHLGHCYTNGEVEPP